MKSLRTRLLISHILPLVIIILLIGIAVDYMVETQILLPNMADELTNEAKLLAELTALQTEIWEDPEDVQDYLARIEPLLRAYVTVFDSTGKYLASTDPYTLQANSQVDINPTNLQSEISIIQTTFGVYQEASVVDVFVPVLAKENTILGVIQMTYHLENVYDQILALRRGIVGILTFGVFLGSGIALYLSSSLSRPLMQVNESIKKITTGQEIELIEEKGPEEIRNLTRTVNTLVSRIEALETTRRKLLSNLVHEIGRPLGALLLALQALQAGAAKNQELRQEMLTGMEGEINVLRRLLKDLTGLYDQYVGTFTLENELINLNEMLPGLVRNQQDAALIKGINWNMDIHPNLPMITIDRDRLAQAIGNLVDNAIKFTPQDGSITFSAGFLEKEVWISVLDNGPGIPVEDQTQIFTRFYQGRSETRFPQGMGLGLNIAHDLVAAQQGRLEFESVPGEGSSFTIWLPIPQK